MENKINKNNLANLAMTIVSTLGIDIYKPVILERYFKKNDKLDIKIFKGTSDNTIKKYDSNFGNIITDKSAVVSLEPFKKLNIYLPFIKNIKNRSKINMAIAQSYLYAFAYTDFVHVSKNKYYNAANEKNPEKLKAAEFFACNLLMPTFLFVDVIQEYSKDGVVALDKVASKLKVPLFYVKKWGKELDVLEIPGVEKF